jgi:hypothetical protein
LAAFYYEKPEYAMGESRRARAECVSREAFMAKIKLATGHVITKDIDELPYSNVFWWE